MTRIPSTAMTPYSSLFQARRPRRQHRSLVAMSLLAAMGLWSVAAFAASPIQVFVEIEGDPNTQGDNFQEARNLSWPESEQPVRLVLFREANDQVLLPDFNPDDATAVDVRQAAMRAISEWNGIGTSDFEYAPTPRYSDFVFDERFPLGPDRAQLDGYNLITFLNPNVDYSEIDDAGFATTTIFFFTKEVDFSEGIPEDFLEFFISRNDDRGTFLLDLDEDDIPELEFERRVYPGGEILDADIIFNQAVPFRLLPADEDNLPGGTTPDLIRGVLDIQALMTRELGHLMGGDSSQIPTSIMYSEYAANIDTDGEPLPDDGSFRIGPYEARDLDKQTDARVTASILYPTGNASGISGTVYRGAGVDGFFEETFQGEVVQQIPVFAGRPAGFNSGELPGDAFSDRGAIRMESNVITGLSIKQFQDDFLQATQAEDGSYIFRGLPQANDWGLYITPTFPAFAAPQGAPTIFSQVFNSIDESGEVVEEFYGGALIPPVFTAENPTDETADDGQVQNPWVRASLAGFGGFEAGFTNAQLFVTNTSFTVRVTSSQGSESLSSTQINNENLPAGFGIIEDDEFDFMATTPFLMTGDLLVTPSVELYDEGNTGVPDDVLFGYTLQSRSAESITVELRMELETSMTFEDEDGTFVVIPPTINGAQKIVAGPVRPVPGSFETWDNNADPRIRAIFRLSEPASTPVVRYDVLGLRNLSSLEYKFPIIDSEIASLNLTNFEDIPDNRESSAINLIYFQPVVLPPAGTAFIRLSAGGVEYRLTVDSGHPLEGEDNDDTTDTRNRYADDPFVSAPVTVGSGITPNIDFVTNNGTAPNFGLIPLFPAPVDPNDPDPDAPDIDPSDDVPSFDDESPAGGGNVVPEDDFYAFGGALGDVDNDGDLDMFVAGSGRPEDSFDGAALANRLLINRLYDRDVNGTIVFTGAIRFDDVTFGADLLPGTTDDTVPYQQDATYCITLGDFDKDDDLDAFIGNFAGPGGLDPQSVFPGRLNRLWINQGGDQGGTIGTFVDRTNEFLPGFFNNPVDAPYPSAIFYTVPLIGFGSFNTVFSDLEGNLATWQVPGSGELFDITTSAVTADFNNDGLLDLVIGNSNIWMDFLGTAGIRTANLFQEDLEFFTIEEEDPKEPPDPSNTRGEDPPVLVLVPAENRPILPGETFTDVSPLYASERLLLNRGFTSAGQWRGFSDETLGRDGVFGGGGLEYHITLNDNTIITTPEGQPGFTGLVVVEVRQEEGNTLLFDDRLPPLYPNYRDDDFQGQFEVIGSGTDAAVTFDEIVFNNNTANYEFDASHTFAVLAAPINIVSGTSPDIIMMNRREPASTVGSFRQLYTKHAGHDTIYNNLDVTDDGVADGYFGHFQGGSDSALVANVVTTEGPTGIVLTSPLMTVLEASVNDDGVRFDYIATPLPPIPRFEGDPGDDTEDPSETDHYSPITTDNSSLGVVGDFDYRGRYHIMAINVFDGGFNSQIMRHIDGVYRGNNIDMRSTGTIGSFGANDQPFSRGLPDSSFATNEINDANNGSPFIRNTATGSPVLAGRPIGGTVADFNLDGDLEIITASDTANPVGLGTLNPGNVPGILQYFTNDTFANFTEVEAFGDVPTGSFSSVLDGDLDNDGDPDLVAFTFGQGIRVIYNSTVEAGPNPLIHEDRGAFVDVSTAALPPGFGTELNPGVPGGFGFVNTVTAAGMADVNGDGLLDIAVGRGAYNTIQGDNSIVLFNTGVPPKNVGMRMFKSPGAPSPAPSIIQDIDFAVTFPTADFRLADFTGDGFPDLLQINRGLESNLYHNIDGSEGFNLLGNGQQIDPNGTIDFNGPLPDGVFVNQSGFPGFALPFPPNNSAALLGQTAAVANFNPLAPSGGPGVLDIFIGNGPSAPNQLFLNAGAGFFTFDTGRIPRILREGTSQDANDTRDAVAADFNGDGFVDLFLLNLFQTSGSTVVKESSRLFFNDGFGNFTDVTAGADGIMRTADDRLPLLTGAVVAAIAGDFDFAGDASEDLDGDGLLREFEPEFFPAHVFETGVATAIADQGLTNLTIDVGNRGAIEEITASVTLAHTAVGQLTVRLIHPDGTSAVLFTSTGGSEDNMNTTVFDDDATDSIAGALAPFGGTFRPQTPLSVFDGKDAFGQWQFEVLDGALGETGEIASLLLSIDTAPGVVDRIEPFNASYDIVIARSDATNILLINDGQGNFTVSGSFPIDLRSSKSLAMGNMFLRTTREVYGATVVDRPMVDIIIGHDQVQSEGNALSLMLNRSNVSPGTFTNVGYEFPIPVATSLNSVDADGVSGNYTAISLGDVDTDGDLDVFLGNGGRFTTGFVGMNSILYLNRVIGDNTLALTRDPGARQPGLGFFPQVTLVTPPLAARGQDIGLVVTGSHFEPGSTLDFGEGIRVVDYDSVRSDRILVRVRIAGDAPTGTRPVIVRDPLGLTHRSPSPLFTVTTTAGGGTSAQDWDLYE